MNVCFERSNEGESVDYFSTRNYSDLNTASFWSWHSVHSIEHRFFILVFTWFCLSLRVFRAKTQKLRISKRKTKYSDWKNSNSENLISFGLMHTRTTSDQSGKRSRRKNWNSPIFNPALFPFRPGLLPARIFPFPFPTRLQMRTYSISRIIFRFKDPQQICILTVCQWQILRWQ